MFVGGARFEQVMSLLRQLRAKQSQILDALASPLSARPRHHWCNVILVGSESGRNWPRQQVLAAGAWLKSADKGEFRFGLVATRALERGAVVFAQGPCLLWQVHVSGALQHPASENGWVGVPWIVCGDPINVGNVVSVTVRHLTEPGASE